eukprot:m.214923 g.214923  ORF g.214923 m.214923 type:complete len:70 (-) comp27440_c0_seq1:16-225(-)
MHFPATQPPPPPIRCLVMEAASPSDNTQTHGCRGDGINVSSSDDHDEQCVEGGGTRMNDTRAPYVRVPQ